MSAAMHIVDAHTHVASTRFTPPPFMEGVIDNVMAQMRLSPVQLSRTKLTDRLLSAHQDHDALAQLRQMDTLGVAKAVLLLPDLTYALPGAALTIDEMYLEHSRIQAAHPNRFEVFAGVDPRWGKDGFDLFVKGIEEYGFRGLKLYPPCGYRPDDAMLDPYYEYCDAKGLPVLIHIGPTSPALSFAEAHPMFVDAPARKYRRASFILAHGAVNYRSECVRLCTYRPNVYLDLSGAQCSAASPQSDRVAQLLSAGINHKIIFGTDWPLNNHLALNRGLIDLVCSTNAPDASRPADHAQLVLARNIERLLVGGCAAAELEG